MSTSTLQIIKHYHQQTKHRPGAYARSAGFMDWANQPLPYRLYQGAEKIRLPLPSLLKNELDNVPASYLYERSTKPAKAICLESIAALLQNSLGLSAWKSYNGTEWALRVNPSSGNLHPTECYLLLPDLEIETEGNLNSEHKNAYSTHYNPYINSLEKRAVLSESSSELLNKKQGFAVVLTSIAWREAWKYGERAYRYCQHDLGHALAALNIAANLNGWQVEVLENVSNKKVQSILGLNQSNTVEEEVEYVDCICWVSCSNDHIEEVKNPEKVKSLEEVKAWLNDLPEITYVDPANQLSQSHQDWPIIDDVFNATHQQDLTFLTAETISSSSALSEKFLSVKNHAEQTDSSLIEQSAQALIHQRRSAQSFDAIASTMSIDTFVSQLQKTLPEKNILFSLLPQPAQTHLMLFVHHVEGINSGLYLWLRNPSHLNALKSAMHSDFEWSQTIENQPLYLLKKGDYRKITKAVSCEQDIAADSTYSLGMLTKFEDNLIRSASQYPLLFWETGMIGQALYLAAESSGYRGTGIGCFFDDLVHDLLGLKDQQWQSLYHFTVGKHIDDMRISTKPAYFHLQASAE